MAKSPTNHGPLEGCWCDSQVPATQCCLPFLEFRTDAPTAEALMRSRYSAYVIQNKDYLLATWYPATAPKTLEFVPEQNWLGLKIVALQQGGEEDNQGTVEFVARSKTHGQGHRLHEISHFEKIAGRWFYVGGEILKKR